MIFQLIFQVTHMYWSAGVLWHWMENNFLLESLGVSQIADSNLVMYFMVNTAFVNFID